MSESSLPAVLLIEDDFDGATLALRAVKKSGVRITLKTVSDGEQALEYLQGENAFADRNQHPFPTLVLLDWKLPRRTGLEVLQWIRAQKHMDKLPVVILTSSREQEDIDQAYAAGANSYLHKPVEFAHLVEILGRLHLYWLKTNVTAAG